jgi:hypothetical protein
MVVSTEKNLDKSVIFQQIILKTQDAIFNGNGIIPPF